MQESKQSAPESLYIRRGRKKLSEKLQEEKQLITEEALEEQVQKIQASIARTLSYRVTVKTKNPGLFDGNQNPQKASRKIDEIISKIKKLYQL